MAYTPAGEIQDSLRWLVFSVVWVLFWLVVAFAVRGVPPAYRPRDFAKSDVRLHSRGEYERTPQKARAIATGLPSNSA
jgi:hypothetical protein